jgi:hypothetical protein
VAVEALDVGLGAAHGAADGAAGACFEDVVEFDALLAHGAFDEGAAHAGDGLFGGVAADGPAEGVADALTEGLAHALADAEADDARDEARLGGVEGQFRVDGVAGALDQLDALDGQVGGHGRGHLDADLHGELAEEVAAHLLHEALDQLAEDDLHARAGGHLGRDDAR